MYFLVSSACDTAYAVFISLPALCIGYEFPFNSADAVSPVLCVAASVATYFHMQDCFTALGYPDSPTAGAGLWHPLLTLLLVSCWPLYVLVVFWQGACARKLPTPSAPGDVSALEG